MRSMSLYNRILLKRILYTLQMSESRSVIDYFNNLNTLFPQLIVLNYKIVKNERAKLLPQSLLD